MSKKKKLSKRRKAVLEFISQYLEEHNYPPTVREIAEQVGLASPSSVFSHLKALEELGLIIRDPKKPRALEIVDTSIKSNEKQSSITSYDTAEVYFLPLVGEVAAGTPILAEENIEDSIAVPVGLNSAKGDFILKVKGESMVNAGILHGDYVIVQQTPTATNGEIVVALIEDSATVKTFYKEKNTIRLQPENDYMEPIYSVNPLILGKVVGLMRAM